MKWEALRRAVLCRRQPALAVAIATLTFIASWAGTTHASGTVRLTFDGQIDLLDLPNVGSPTAEELGLQDGDPIRLLIEFDRTLPPPNQFGDPGGVQPDRFEIVLDGESFLATNPVNLLSAGVTGASGLSFLLSFVGSDAGELNGIGTSIGLASAVPDIASFQTGDLGFDGSAFPTDLGLDDVTNLGSPATLAILPVPADPLGVTGPLFNINFTGLTVTAIPEPSAAAIALVGLGGVFTRRQRRLSRAA